MTKKDTRARIEAKALCVGFRRPNLRTKKATLDLLLEVMLSVQNDVAHLKHDLKDFRRDLRVKVEGDRDFGLASGKPPKHDFFGC